MIFLKFYLKCPQCGQQDFGDPEGEWLGFNEICEKCDIRMMPEITIKQKEVKT